MTSYCVSCQRVCGSGLSSSVVLCGFWLATGTGWRAVLARCWPGSALEVLVGDGLVAVGARPARTEAATEQVALGTALLVEQALLA